MYIYINTVNKYNYYYLILFNLIPIFVNQMNFLNECVQFLNDQLKKKKKL